MAPLRFRLESVLRYRQQVVELREQELAGLERDLQSARDELERLRQQMAAVAEAIQMAQQAGSIDCAELMGWFRRLQKLGEQEQRQIAAVVEIARRTEAKRGELRAAMQEQQVLDKLKERQTEQHRQEETRKEGQVLDEIGVMRFYRSEQDGQAAALEAGRAA